MFNMTDNRGSLPKTVPCKNSLLGIIESNPDFSIFLYIVKLANQTEFLNNLQANFTLFIPSDNELKYINQNVFINMDPNTAWHIVKSSTLKDRITSEVLEDSPAAFYYTADEANRLYITNISGNTYINGNIKIIKKDVLANNGIIQVIDGLIVPNII
jgi:uncharacterized surface protein with fasciclin (FAS1) repeats